MGYEYSVEAEGLGKCYRAFARPLDRILEAGTLGRWKRHQEFWAIRDVDFRLKPGASLGLVGANGAGKSTLLKVLAGVTAPSRGRYRINGRVASLLELGAGFHADFTGRMNIVTNGVMMGYSRREMRDKLDEIVEFAELGHYMDQPVRTYSSGMALRLAFAIAAAIDPEVLIIDEVFAVGDMYFQKKCVDKIYSFRNRGRTIVFCSHSLYDIRQLCDQAIWMRDGRPAAVGSSVEVTNEYTAYQREHIEVGIAKEIASEMPPENARGPAPTILDARLYFKGTDVETYLVTTGDSVELRVWWSNPDHQRKNIEIGTAFYRQDMTLLIGMGTHLDGYRLSGASGCLVLELDPIELLSGQFTVPVVLFDEGGVHRYQEFILRQNVVVRTPTKQVGLVRAPHAWRNEVGRPLPPPTEGAAS
jgi:ABC-type polysaccharide/polyol phosphate transport system ATPase subunit